MAILDSPILPALTSTTGAEQLVTVAPNRNQAQFKLNGICGLLAGDVGTLAATGTISKRLTTFTGTTGLAVVVNLPLVSGDLREIILMNVSGTASSVVTLTGATGTITSATAGLSSITVGIGTVAHLLSDGTKWYHISNDAIAA